MNKYKFHWRDGAISEMEGDSPEDALRKLGYGAGAIRALDYYDVTEQKKEDALKDAVVELADALQTFANSALTQPMEYGHFIDLAQRSAAIRDKVKSL